MTNTDFHIIKIDGELRPAVKLEALRDGVTSRKYVSDLIRQDLNRRQATRLDIKPIKA